MSDSPEVGRDPNSPLCAYGDDSQYRRTLAYAYVFFKRKDVTNAKKKLDIVREKYRIPECFPLHCRKLFSHNQREKHGLTHLSNTNVKQLLADLIKKINKVSFLLSYSYYIEPENGILYTKNKKDDLLPRVYDPKGMLSTLSQTCLASLSQSQCGFIAEDCEIYTSSDKTKIKYHGNQKRQADSVNAMLMPQGMASRRHGNVRVKPHYKNGSEESLLQVADVLAYICSHAVRPECTDPFFSIQLQRVKFKLRSIMKTDFSHEPETITRNY